MGPARLCGGLWVPDGLAAIIFQRFHRLAVFDRCDFFLPLLLSLFLSVASCIFPCLSISFHNSEQSVHSPSRSDEDMPSPKELPGFYYDAEKNRYFPIKGPIPGSSRSSTAKIGPKKSIPKSPPQERSPHRQLLKRTSKLLHARELNGNIIKSYNWRCNIREELLKIQASQPVVWKYQQTDRVGISALEQLNIDVETSVGVVKTDVLLSGNLNGSLWFFEVRKEQAIDVTWMPDCVKNYANGKTYEHDELPASIVANYGGLTVKPSRISCIRLGPKFSSHGDDEDPDVRHVLFTHLGSETSGGSVHIMDLAEPLMPNVIGPIKEVASFKCTLWTAEYDYTRPRAVIGTNIGAASVDLETGQTSWFLHCKSDVFAEQIFNSATLSSSSVLSCCNNSSSQVEHLSLHL
ncbi:hypothetical protein K1719_026143 [Acacia pycnantha]|nr:hypothetical protein K1719_026143 [Acacia pycnantha]